MLSSASLFGPRRSRREAMASIRSTSNSSSATSRPILSERCHALLGVAVQRRLPPRGSVLREDRAGDLAHLRASAALSEDGIRFPIHGSSADGKQLVLG